MTTSPNFNFLKNHHPVENYSIGQIIFIEGQVGDVMYYIKSGEVQITLHGKTLVTLGAGEIFGEMALIESHIRFANAHSITECELIAINERDFNFLIQEHPYFALNVMRVLTERLRKKAES